MCADDVVGAGVLVDKNEVSRGETCILNSSGHVWYLALTKGNNFLNGAFIKGMRKIFTLSQRIMVWHTSQVFKIITQYIC